MSIKTRVRGTSESVMGDEEVQYQRDGSRLVREVTREFDVPTSLTPDPNHLSSFYLCGLYERGQQSDQPTSREPFWVPSEWYRC